MNLSFRKLKADEIDVRVSQISDKGCALLLYKNARVDMDLLDETVGAMNWKRAHSRENANCTVSIYNEATGEWVSKEDVGTESNTEAQKGLASDSFKRACVNWGIGRELYTAPFIWIHKDNVNLDNRGGKWRTNDRFSVKLIEYDEQRRISRLIIWNDRKKFIAFDWASGKPPVFEDDGTIGIPADKPPEDYKPEPAKIIPHPAAQEVLCEICKQPIQGRIGKTGEVQTPQDVAANTLVRTGKKMCAACFKSWQTVQQKAGK